MSTPVYSWGKSGHRIIGEIAFRNLNPSTQNKLKKILGHESLAEASVWPDKIRSEKSWTCASPMHYISIDEHETPSYKKVNILTSTCVFIKILRNASSNINLKKDAIRFIAHLIGDIHQPLHIGLSCDRGGNDIQVQWFYNNTNFHNVWDQKLIEYQKLSFTEFAAILNTASVKQKKEIQNSSIVDWINESKRLRVQLYRCYSKDKCELKSFYEPQCQSSHPKKKISLMYQYEYQNHGILTSQILKGGLRLAKVLDNILNNKKLNRKFELDLQRVLKNKNISSQIHSCVMKAIKGQKKHFNY